MESFSGINEKTRYSCDLEIYPYLRDHHLEGKTILPAVESLIVIVRAVHSHYPRMNISYLQNASFHRFLPIAPDVTRQPVCVNMESSDDGVMTASLRTSLKSKTGHISREVEHARVDCIAADVPACAAPPFIAIHKLKGHCISVPAFTVYRDLVPFGAAYQNIIGDLSVSEEGALAYLSGGDCEADEGLLGSPFPFDAVMHLACVWAQRFAGMVTFPVGFEKRIIYQKTRKREEYLGRIVPVSVTKESLTFDAWIYQDDIMCEWISGIQMMDVTHGRIKPPEWILDRREA